MCNPIYAANLMRVKRNATGDRGNHDHCWHSTGLRDKRPQDISRQNCPNISGKICLTYSVPSHAPNRPSNAASSSRSSTRNRAASLPRRHDRLLRRQAGPPCWKRSQVAAGGPEKDPVLAPLVSSSDELDLLAALRMEWMRDPNRTGHFLGAACSPFGIQTHVEAATPILTCHGSAQCRRRQRS